MRSNLSKTQVNETKQATTSEKKTTKKWSKQRSNKIFLPQKLLKLVWPSYFPCLLVNIYQGIYLGSMVISWKRSLFKFKPIFFLIERFFLTINPLYINHPWFILLSYWHIWHILWLCIHKKSSEICTGRKSQKQLLQKQLKTSREIL